MVWLNFLVKYCQENKKDICLFFLISKVLISAVKKSLNRNVIKGERWDSNPQPLEPQSNALPLSYTHRLLGI